MEIHEVAPGLIDALSRLGDEYGPLGVALAAAKLTDTDVLIRALTKDPVGDPRPEESVMPEQWARYCVLCERGFMPEGNELTCERCRRTP